jgi:hypothetical protein
LRTSGVRGIPWLQRDYNQGETRPVGGGERTNRRRSSSGFCSVRQSVSAPHWLGVARTDALLGFCLFRGFSLETLAPPSRHLPSRAFHCPDP